LFFQSGPGNTNVRIVRDEVFVVTDKSSSSVFDKNRTIFMYERLNSWFPATLM
jgi:hypothetical protein